MTTEQRRKTITIPLTYKRKLLLYSLLISMLPVILIGLISSWTMKSIVQEEADQSQQIILKQLAAQVDELLLDLENTSVRLANDQTIKKSLEAGISQQNLQLTLDMMDLVMNTKANAKVQFDISLYYARHSQIYSSANGIIRDIEPPFTEILRKANQLYFGSMVIAPGTIANLKHMLLLRPVPLNSTNPIGYLIIHLDTFELTRFLDRMETGKVTKMLVVDDQGVILASQHEEESGARLAPTEQLYSSVYHNSIDSESEITFDHVDYQISTSRSSMKNWTIIAMTPVSELKSASNKLMALTWSIAGFMLLVCFGFSLVGFRQIYLPIRALAGKLGIQSAEEDELQHIDASLDNLTARNSELQIQLNEQLPYLKDSLFLQMMRGEMTSRDIRKIMLDYDFPGNEGWFYVVVVEIEETTYTNIGYQEEDRILIMYGLRNIIEELFHSSFRSFATVMPKSGQVVVLISMDACDPEEANKIVLAGEKIVDCSKSCLKLITQITISSPRKSYASISESYEEALRLMNYKWVLGNRTIISADTLQKSNKKSIRMMAKRKMAIMDALAHHQFDKAEEELNSMIALIPSSLQVESILGLFSILIGEIEQLVKERGFELNEMFEYTLLEYLLDLSSLEEVRAWLSDEVFNKVADCLTRQDASHHKSMIPQVLHYIHAHFDSDLSLQHLASLFNVSATTLSRMFKEQTDSNYLDYITRYRIDRAKEWLTSSDLSIKEIAERIHYSNVQNFTRIFKKVTGETPGNYRKSGKVGKRFEGNDGLE